MNSTTESSEDLISESSDENTSQIDNLDLNCKIINNYNIIYELGRGSYSIVWLAYNINTQKFYALKVQNPSEYDEGYDEIKFVKKLPENPNVFNNIYESFTEIVDDNKYLCSVWNLHSTNIDTLIRKGDYRNGFSLDNVKYIMNQLIKAIKILHKNYKVFHGDIKTDNILVKGINERDQYVINEYIKDNFNEKYTIHKKEFWVNKGNKLDNICKMNKKDKNNIRKQIHQDMTNKIIQDDSLKLSINSKYLEKIEISLADFGTYCSEDNYYDESFGTRYYQAPEIILMGKCSYPVDIWALGCTFFELLTGQILFDPDKDSKYSRDYYHLCLINETCGNFPPSFLKKTKFYKDFFDSKFNIINYIYNSNNKLNECIKKIEGIDDSDKKTITRLLSQMLQIDPTKRINIIDLSKESFFNDYCIKY